MGRTRHLDVQLSGYADDVPSWHPYGSEERPARGVGQLTATFTGARDRGALLVLVIEGPDAEEGVRLVRDLVDNPPANLREASHFIGGHSSRLPAAPSLEARTREILRAWGMERAYDEMTGGV